MKIENKSKLQKLMTLIAMGAALTAAQAAQAQSIPSASSKKTVESEVIVHPALEVSAGSAAASGGLYWLSSGKKMGLEKTHTSPLIFDPGTSRAVTREWAERTTSKIREGDRVVVNHQMSEKAYQLTVDARLKEVARLKTTSAKITAEAAIPTVLVDNNRTYKMGTTLGIPRTKTISQGKVLIRDEKKFWAAVKSVQPLEDEARRLDNEVYMERNYAIYRSGKIVDKTIYAEGLTKANTMREVDQVLGNGGKLRSIMVSDGKVLKQIKSLELAAVATGVVSIGSLAVAGYHGMLDGSSGNSGKISDMQNKALKAVGDPTPSVSTRGLAEQVK
ncbi:MAG: hypothetical protein H7222_16650 [Methylotenera sp.]|nr:hypothetical protein [Oligoflexia bacterium]